MNLFQKNRTTNILTLLIVMSFFSLINISVAKPKKDSKKEEKSELNSEGGKKKFTFIDAMKFKSIKKTVMSDDGKWLAYNVAPDRGDGYLVIKNTKDTSAKEIQIERGDNPNIAANGSYLALNKLPKFIDQENSKAEKEKPKNDLLLVDLSNGNIEEIGQSNSFNISNDGKWLTYKAYSDKKPDEKSKRIVGENLYLRNIKSKAEILIKDVSDFMIDSSANYIIYSVATSTGKNNGIFFRELNKEYAPETTIQKDSNYYFGNITWNIQSQKLAYLAGKLDSATSKPAKLALKVCDFKNNYKVTELVKEDFLTSWFLPNTNRLEFTKNGNLLYFGIKPESDKVPEKDDKADKKKIKEEDLYNMEKIAEDAQMWTWHYNDPTIVTQQKIDWKQKKDRTFFAVYDLVNSKMQMDTTINSSNVVKNENENFVLLTDDAPYQKEITWKGWYFDVYNFNLKTGEKKLVYKYLNYRASLSPDGKFTALFDTKKWYIHNNETNITTEVSSKLNIAFHDLDNDVPKEPDPYGFASWMQNTNNSYSALVYDEFDIWGFNCNTFDATNITNQIGRNTQTQYRIAYRDRNKDFITNNDLILLNGFSKIDKSTNLASFEMQSKSILNKLDGEKNYAFRMKPEFSNEILYTKQSFEEFPDYWTADLKLSNPIKVSDVNPEMKDFIWGTTHLTKWANSKGDSLEGYYVLPDNYDPKKKYPVVIYFYEQMSQDKNRFIQPSNLHRPCFQVYLGDEYVIFLPDVKYYNPHPGQSSLDALVSGSRHLANIGIADSNKIGIWGHSWSGYQGAYIVTQTDFFKACVSGAPVGNMTSAYSGIRLGSGLARQFQYEQQQSRIGGSLIDSLDRYIENSPVFFADKMNTPTLIMFGDDDDAVPYPQGIELYLAFRRYNKPAIMLQYEGEPHHLKKYPNKVDYTIKMKEFYDHFLQGKPAPSWLTKGVEYKGGYTR